MTSHQLRSPTGVSHTLRASPGGTVVGSQPSCRIASEVIAELNQERALDGLVGVTILFRDDLKPRPPFYLRDFKSFDRMVEDVFDRVNLIVGEPDGVIPNLESYRTLAWHGAYTLVARVRFIDELVKQPEIAECLDWFADIDFPEPDPDGIGLDLN
jgi:hypothetical protein